MARDLYTILQIERTQDPCPFNGIHCLGGTRKRKRMYKCELRLPPCTCTCTCMYIVWACTQLTWARVHVNSTSSTNDSRITLPNSIHSQMCLRGCTVKQHGGMTLPPSFRFYLCVPLMQHCHMWQEKRLTLQPTDHLHIGTLVALSTWSRSTGNG